MREHPTVLDRLMTYWMHRHKLQELREARAEGNESSDNHLEQGRIKGKLARLRRRLHLDGGNRLTAVIDDVVVRERTKQDNFRLT